MSAGLSPRITEEKAALNVKKRLDIHQGHRSDSILAKRLLSSQSIILANLH